MKVDVFVRAAVVCLAVAGLSACDTGKGKGGQADLGDGGSNGTAISVTVTIEGEGSVAIDGTTSCTSATDPCIVNAVIGDTTQITATPATGYQFSSWNCNGSISTSATLDLTLATGAACTVVFTPISETLMVSISDANGNAQGGSVSSSTGGIACGPGTANQCSASLAFGTMVTLTAIPQQNYTFTGWQGCSTSTDAILNLTVDAPTTCVARFTRGTFPLTLSVVGSGAVNAFTATVSNLASCNSATCAAVNVDAGDTVTLVAAADSGWELAGWTGDCTGDAATTTTTLAMTGPKSCVVTFAQSNRTLTLTATGGGSITRDPLGTGDASPYIYTSGTTVTLTAVPDPNRVFLSWTGDCNGTDDITSVTMTTDKSCTATFGPAQRGLTVTTVGPGTVERSPAGTAGGVGQSFYDHGTEVTLTAMPSAGFELEGWSGDCFAEPANATTTTVTMDADKTCTATFKARLTVVVVGSGSVTSAPSGIATASGEYDALFAQDQVVTLTAQPNVGSQQISFLGWTGDCAGADVSTMVTLSAAKTCTATFTITPYKIDVSLAASAPLGVTAPGGSVSGTRSGNGATVITCGGDCGETNIPSNESVTLVATPSAGYRFVQWSTCSDATTATLVVPMNSDKVCVANFMKVYNVTLTSLTGSGTLTFDKSSTLTSPDATCTTGNCSVTMDWNETTTATAVPANSETRVSAFTCSVGNRSGDVYTIANPTANVTCSVTFAPKTVTIAGAGTNGTVSPSSTVVNSGGTGVQLTAAANANYHFTGWSGSFTSGSGTATGCSGTSNPITVSVANATHGATYTCTAQFTINDVTIAGAAGSNGSVGPLNTATTVGAAATTLTANPASNYHVSGWSGTFTSGSGTATGCSGTATTANVQITAGTQNAVYTCTATFAINSVTIAGASGGNGTVAPTSTATTVGAAATTLTATPSSNYHVTSWSGSFTTGSGTATGCTGSAASVNVQITGASQSAVYTCTATFAINGVTIAGAASGNGTVAPASTSTTVGAAATTLTATASANNHVTGWSGTFTTGSGTATGCSGTATTANVQVTSASDGAVYTCTATFAVNNVTIAGAAGANGSVAPSSTATTVGATATTLTATPSANYHVSGWSGSFTTGSGTATGCSGSGTTVDVAISSATQNAVYTCTASFVINNVTIAGAAGANGSVAPSSTATTVGAAATTLTATPATNYQVASWSGSFTTGSGTATGCSGAGNSKNVQITAGSEGAVYTCTATFSRIQHNVAVTIAGGANGSVSSSPTGINSCTSTGGTCSSLFNQGDSVALTATPNANYRVTWSATSGGTCDGVVSNGTGEIRIMTFSSLNAAKACTATFAPVQYTVTFSAGTGGTASASCGASPCTVNHGTNVTLSASASAAPAPGYRFLSWSAGTGGSCSFTSSGQTLAITSNQNCVANFRALVTVNVVTSPVGAGSTTGSGNYDSGVSVNISTTPSSNYFFRGWQGCTSSGSTNTSFTTPAGPTSVTCTAVYNTLWARSYGEPDDLPKSTEQRDAIRGIAVLNNDTYDPSFGIAGALDTYNVANTPTLTARYGETLLLPESGVLLDTQPERQQLTRSVEKQFGPYGLSLYAAANLDLDSKGQRWATAGGTTIDFNDGDPIFNRYARPPSATAVYESVGVAYNGSDDLVKALVYERTYPVGDDKGLLSNYFTTVSGAPDSYYFGGIANAGSTGFYPRVVRAKPSDGAEIWDREICYGGKDYRSTSLVSLQQTDDGGLVGLAFATYQVGQNQLLGTLLFRMSSAGALLWTQFLYPATTEYNFLVGASITPIPGGSTFLLSGVTYDVSAKGYRPFLAEIKDEGNKASVVWSRMLQSLSNRALSSILVYNAISVDDRGAVLALGVGGEFAALRVKLDGAAPSGMEWQYSYGRSADPASTETPYAIASLPSSGGYLLGGSSTDPSNKFTQGGQDMWALRIDDSGATGVPVAATGFARNALDYVPASFGITVLDTDCTARNTPEPPAPLDWSIQKSSRTNKHKTQAGLN